MTYQLKKHLPHQNRMDDKFCNFSFYLLNAIFLASSMCYKIFTDFWFNSRHCLKVFFTSLNDKKKSSKISIFMQFSVKIIPICS